MDGPEVANIIHDVRLGRRLCTSHLALGSEKHFRKRKGGWFRLRYFSIVNNSSTQIENLNQHPPVHASGLFLRFSEGELTVPLSNAFLSLYHSLASLHIIKA